MANRRQELSAEQRKIAIKLYLKGEKQNRLAELFSVNKSTISRLINKFQRGENEENRPTRGRRPLTDERDDRLLIRSVRKGRRQTLGEIVDNFNQGNTQKISSRTVQRRLHFYGFRRHRVRKTLTVSTTNRKVRIKWCKEMKQHTVENFWKKIIFSDETKVEISTDNNLYVWRKKDEAYRPECVGQHGQGQGRGRNIRVSCMFWGCVTYSGVGTLVPVEGNIDTNKYINILDQHLWPVVAKNFGNSPYIFQDDNAPCHNSSKARAWKSENNLTCLNWPSQSPDLNIIENVWHILKIRLRKILHTINSQEHLVREVQNIWSTLTEQYIINLYHTIPYRLQAVISSEGHITKY